MKGNLLMLLACLFINQSHSQTVSTVTFQPGACEGTDAIIASCVPCGYASMNFGSSEEFDAIAWTNGGNISNARGLINFRLSDLPPNAVIVSAQLSLFWNPTSVNAGHSQLSGSNEALLSRITSSWSENTVTWLNQPLTSAVNQVLLPASISSNQDYTNIDVTALVQDMVNDPANSFGFMLQLQNEQYYRSLVFASSDHLNNALHPILQVSYIDSTNSTCFTLQPGECDEGIDAEIAGCIPCGYDVMNFGNIVGLEAVAWTNGGAVSNARGLLYFNLSAVPANAIINSAELSLFWNPNSSNTGHSQLSGSNEGLLQRITSPWGEQTVTWNTQPSTTVQNEIVLPASLTTTQDYLNIDVSTLVQDMVADPLNSFGFMLKLQLEQYYRSLIFASSDHPNPDLHPRLSVCYEVPTSLNESTPVQFALAPNPFIDETTLTLSQIVKDAKVLIYDVSGKVIDEFYFSGKEIRIKRPSHGSGIYLIKIQSATNTANCTFVVQ
jgi:hypothetical protein